MGYLSSSRSALVGHQDIFEEAFVDIELVAEGVAAVPQAMSGPDFQLSRILGQDFLDR